MKQFLIALYSTQPDPRDLKKICASDEVQRTIVKMCPDNMVKEALKSFSDSCTEAGQKVSIIDTNKPTPTGTSSGGSDGNGGSGSGNPSATNSGSSPTGTSAGTVYKVDSSIVAAVVALVGLVSTM
ncbi:hypothetical protein AJ78_05327 [Emergomyces pasteurianus Ep9510]|uniref:Uncharacterized protein n=1 Tax=Emergomyces pasteurianus Ep9510 TaxID=1447872 RepID=A0A1J9Q291_9EURO|nr:hypothetical protein AJ78_05327 [Emergomyces pasteurianus Ep9510]